MLLHQQNRVSPRACLTRRPLSLLLHATEQHRRSLQTRPTRGALPADVTDPVSAQIAPDRRDGPPHFAIDPSAYTCTCVIVWRKQR